VGMGRRPVRSPVEDDVVTGWRHVMCYVQRAGVRSGVKRAVRRRERRAARTAIRKGSV
jgi:hypothetical protein